jgi:WD40 repeat protein
VSGSVDRTIMFWDLTHSLDKPKSQTFTTNHTGALSSLAFSPDGKFLASGSNDKSIILWDVAERQPTGQSLIGHKAPVLGLAFSPDGQRLASASADNTILLWDLTTHQPHGLPLTGHTDPVLSLAFSENGQFLVSGSADGTVILWNLAKDRPILAGQKGPVSNVAFSPNGKWLASSSCGDFKEYSNNCTKGEIRLWDVASGQLAGVLPPPNMDRGHTDWVNTVAFSPNSKFLASGGADNKIFLWDPEERKPIKEFLSGHTKRIYSVAFSQDGDILASGSEDGTIRLWDVATGVERAPLPSADHGGSVYTVAFNSDKKTLASGSCRRLTKDGKYCAQGEIRLWDITTSKFLGSRQTKQAAPVLSVAFNPNGNILAAASCKPSQDPQDTQDTQEHGPCSQGGIQLWDVVTHEALAQSLSGHSGTVLSLAFTPDGKTLASSSSDKTVMLWDVETLEPLGQALRDHTAEVYSVAFSPDSKKLASGSGDRTVRLWNAEVDFESLKHRACQIVRRNLSPEEWGQYMKQWSGYMTDDHWHTTCLELKNATSTGGQRIAQTP